MKKKLKKYISGLLTVIAVLVISTVLNFLGIGEDTQGTAVDPDQGTRAETSAVTETDDPGTEKTEADEPSGSELYIDPEGVYTSKDDVALYIYLYGELPDNFMTKSEAQKLGWEGGSLEPFAPGMCIGGDRFGNYEGLLPEADGRSYKECDIDTLYATSRGAKRIVYSNDGLIYYTEDHYESFELIYPEED